jgi:hypothetical protein
MIWSTLYHHVTILVHWSWLHLLFTVASVHWCQVITQLVRHTCNRSVEPSFILIFSTLITWLNVMSYVQWAPSSHVWALQHFWAISPSWQVLLTHIYLWTNHLCISYLNTLVHLGCHSIIKTKQGPFTGAPARISAGSEVRRRRCCNELARAGGDAAPVLHWGARLGVRWGDAHAPRKRWDERVASLAHGNSRPPHFP